MKWLAGAFAACFIAIAIVVGTGRSPIDLEVASWMAAHRDPTGIDVFMVIAFLGRMVSLAVLAVLVGAYLQRRMGWRPVGWLVLALLGVTVLYIVINLLFASVRPPADLRAVIESGYSFPSGHSCQTVAFWITTAILVGADRGPRARRVLRAIAAVMVVLTAGSRIYLGVHWTFDVLGGLALGAFWVCCVFALRDRRAR